MEATMHRSEAEFCQDEAARLLKLAMECTDPELQRNLADMANGWAARARMKDGLSKIVALRARQSRVPPSFGRRISRSRNKSSMQ
jgi:hypothetical protein